MTTRFVLLTTLLLAGWLAAPPASGDSDKDYALQRQQLVQTVAEHVRETSDYLGRETLDPRVTAALAGVPRHEFVPERLRDHAYDNRPLPIGHSQTISQPYIVAIMTDLLDLGPQDRVLEIGTGSGYQAAILATLIPQVYSIEIIEPLGEAARERLARLDFDNVQVRIGDGYYGWQEHAPFDAIVVTAAASHVPPPLIQQLKPGGRMIIPVGSHFMTQQLLLVTKSVKGEVRTRQILPVAFVPLTGGH
jgi:protein-L-isoaspartate(D-aspartate) O-methyltransferase